ncbi:hypothetical protein MA16_Dca006344 [Dendrobium catenatum]|uniref:PIFI-like Ig-like domain-containing protein n=1 Tax=Dendrobium catenatum TaxID=906689 RepID=A0A2I0W9M0_9ASPA|nr:hypothetical protein MA16_Dca006344 [Dendrobium catenatum]
MGEKVSLSLSLSLSLWIEWIGRVRRRGRRAQGRWMPGFGLVKFERGREVGACAWRANGRSALGELDCYFLGSVSIFDIFKCIVDLKTSSLQVPSSLFHLMLIFDAAAPTLWREENRDVACFKPLSNESYDIFDKYKALCTFYQPIPYSGEPRVMRIKERGEADLPIYTIKIQAPKYAVSLIFSFTNGVEWDGPYKLQFQVLKKWRNKPITFFNEGLAEELSKEGACEGAIFPDSHVIIESCKIDDLYLEGGDRCKLDLLMGCMDPNSPLYDPFANVDDGSCPVGSDSEDE